MDANDTGVSEVVGEMLMIALVIVLLSVFSAALYNYLPVDREPSVSVTMNNDTLGNITLWHKGGDWVHAEDLSVIVGTDTGRKDYRYNFTFTDYDSQFLLVHQNQKKKKVFDLGSNITVRMTEGMWGNETVKLVTPKTVIYTGRISP